MTDFDMPPPASGFAMRGGWLVNALAAKFGLTKEQAAGIVGNLGFESGGFKELQEIGVSSFERGGYGWAQWTGPRRTSFEAWCSANSLTPSSDEANYGYLCEELGGSYINVITDVKRQDTVEKAVWSVGQTYERPGGTTALHLPGYDGRLDYARQALAGGAHAVPVPSPAPVPTPAPDPVPAPPGPSPTPAAPVLTRTLRVGVPKGDDVKQMQTQLKALGFYVGVDSQFGMETYHVVRAFQQAKGLIADGIVMPADPDVPNSGETWAALFVAKPLTII